MSSPGSAAIVTPPSSSSWQKALPLLPSAPPRTQLHLRLRTLFCCQTSPFTSQYGNHAASLSQGLVARQVIRACTAFWVSNQTSANLFARVLINFCFTSNRPTSTSYHFYQTRKLNENLRQFCLACVNFTGSAHLRHHYP